MKEKIIFKAIVGSQSYGTNTPESDIDLKGVYMQSTDDLVTFNYKQQIEVSKDETYYEVRRFLELLQTANPTVLELLFSPEDCILEDSAEFNLIRSFRHMFLTKKCLNSFSGYAFQQIQKAKGLDKKINWEDKRVVRKNPIDFIYIYKNDVAVKLTKWLDDNCLLQENCGLSNLEHFRDCYNLYYDFSTDNIFNFKGITTDNSNSVKLSSIPKDIASEGVIFYNKDGYSMHCKDYNEYQEWLTKRNIQRYVDVKNHDQKIDGKNMLHCIRLIETAEEIATLGTINVRRPNKDYLLSIRRGEVNLEELINYADTKLKTLPELFKNSALPDDCDPKFVNDLLLKIRKLNNGK